MQPYTIGLLDPPREMMSFSMLFVRYILTYLEELSLCVTESVNSGCYVLMGCKCFVCAVVVSSKADCNRRVRWGRMGDALPELYLVGSR